MRYQIPVVDGDEQPHEDRGDGRCKLFYLVVRVNGQFIMNLIGDHKTTNDNHGRDQYRVVSFYGNVVVTMNSIFCYPM